MLTLAAPSCPQPQVKAAADSGFYAGPPGGAVAAVPGDIREEINAVLGVTPDCDLEVGAGCTEDDIATAYNSGFYEGPESVPAPALSAAPINRAEINAAMGVTPECDLEVGAGCTEGDITTAYNSGFYGGPPGAGGAPSALAVAPGSSLRAEATRESLNISPMCDLEVGDGCTEGDLTAAYNSGFYTGPPTGAIAPVDVAPSCDGAAGVKGTAQAFVAGCTDPGAVRRGGSNSWDRPPQPTRTGPSKSCNLSRTTCRSSSRSCYSNPTPNRRLGARPRMQDSMLAPQSRWLP